MTRRVCAHLQRWAPGGILPVCRNCPLLSLQARWEYAMSLPEACTEPIPVYRETEPERPAEQTRPLPVIRDPFILGHPQIRPELPHKPEPAKPAVKPKARQAAPDAKLVSVVMFLIALIIAALLYQLPVFGHP